MCESEIGFEISYRFPSDQKKKKKKNIYIGKNIGEGEPLFTIGGSAY
jgi:hypothetical protein